MGRRSLYHRWPRPLRVAITLLLLLLSWVLFRSDSLAQAIEYFQVMFFAGSQDSSASFVAGVLYRPLPVAAICAGTLVLLSPVQAHDWSRHITWVRLVILLPLFVVALAVMTVQSHNPFLYFQF